MELSRVNIKNFRSIESLNLDLNSGCRVLVGINESGKSNILRALNLLDEKSPLKADDVRLSKSDERPIDSAYVRFVFSFNQEEIRDIYDNVQANIFALDKNKPLFKLEDKNLSCEDFINTKAEGLYIANLKSQRRYISSWSWEGTSIIEDWKEVVGTTLEVKSKKDNKTYTLNSGQFFLASDYDYNTDHLNDLDLNDLRKIYDEKVEEIVKDKIPGCIYWKYSEEYLLPARININQFIQNPNICRPLESMFKLAGYKNIKEDVDKARTSGQQYYKNLLKNVAKTATRYIGKVWKDYNNISIEMNPNADSIDIFVTDKEIEVPFADRSDGFKRLVTFLLMISANVHAEHNDQISNNLILFDEPEVALHPTGAKNLRDELIKIGHSNTVLYSTHSIFMIDTDNVERHLIVKKKNEITTVTKVDESRITDEEVIYNALNFSTFSILKSKNLVFEGWTDKKLFLTACAKLKGDRKKLFDAIGKCHAQGAKDFINIAPLFSLSGRQYILVSDNDKAALEYKEKFETKVTDISWFTLNDLTSTEVCTSEDFILPKAHERAFKILAEKLDIAPINFQQLEGKNNKIKIIGDWLKGQKVENVKSVLKEYKIQLYNNLVSSDIDVEKYGSVIDKLLNTELWKITGQELEAAA